MSARATDDNGSLATVSFDPDEGVYVTDWDHWACHELQGAVKPRGPAYLAVAGRAVAVTSGDGLVYAVAEGSDGPPPEISGLMWDASRRVLWIASPQAGLVMCSAPDAKAGIGLN